MFQIISIFVFVSVLAGGAWSIWAGRISMKNIWTMFIGESSNVFGSVRKFKELNTASVLGTFRRGAYILTLTAFIILLFTGFIPVVILGQHLSGYLLMIHAMVAPFFAVGLALLVLLTAHQHRFNPDDRSGLQKLFQKAENSPGQNVLEKVSYWFIIMVAIPAIASVVLSMYPMFGTHGQEILLQSHRYGMLLLVIAGLFHTILVTGVYQPNYPKKEERK